MEGWIKLYRKLQDCCIWQKNEPFDSRSAWIDLLLSATHKQRKFIIDNEILTVERGSFMTSVLKLSEKWKWSRGKTNRYLALLENEQMITTKRTPKGTLVTIVKYDVFQGLEQADGTTGSTTLDTTVDTTIGTTVGTQNKNVKNEKNEKNERSIFKMPKNIFPEDEKLNKAFKEYAEMRKKIKKPILTDDALGRLIKKLNRLSGGDNNLAIAILNQSTDCCYQGLFALKTDDEKKKQGVSMENWKERWGLEDD